MPRAIEDPILAYTAEGEINNVQWASTQPDWIAICYNNCLEILRVWSHGEGAPFQIWTFFPFSFLRFQDEDEVSSELSECVWNIKHLLRNNLVYNVFFHVFTVILTVFKHLFILLTR